MRFTKGGNPMSVQEIKVRNMMRHVKTISGFGPRPDGTEADHLAIRYIKEQLAQVGAKVGALPLDVPVIEEEVVRLEILGSTPIEIPCKPMLRPGLTPPEGITAPLVFVGKAF